MPRLLFAMVCASNQNRSMEAHKVLAENGYQVVSYGVGTQVKLPGPSMHKPNCYPFGTPYKDIHRDLLRKDPELYKQNGLFKMLERNIKVKLSPERWQDSVTPKIDVAITFEERVMDILVDDMAGRTTELMRPLLVINLDVKDNHEESVLAAPQARLPFPRCCHV